MPQYLKIIITLYLLPLCLFAQKGPGGVGSTNGSDMYLWLKADVGVTVATGVSAWADQSGSGNNVTAPSASQQPVYNTSSLIYNSMPVVEFDGEDTANGDELFSSSFSDITDTSHTAFIVWDIDENIPENESALYGMQGSFGTGGFQIDAYDGDLWLFSNNSTIIEPFPNYDAPIITNFFRKSNNRFDVYKNEEIILSNYALNNGSVDMGTRFVLGVERNLTDSRHLEVNISEIIHYKKTLNLAERIIVSNHLSSKYNIPLSSNNFYNEDDSDNGNFDFDVIGIGRATDGTSSLSAQSNGIIGVNTPSTIANDRFLMIGHNNVSLEVDEEINVPSGIRNRLTRLWRASKRNDLGTVTVAMDISFSVNKANFSTANLRLLVDTDDNFTSGTVTYTATSYNSTTGIATFNNVAIADNNYVTIASTATNPYYFGSLGSAGGANGEDIGVAGIDGPGGIGSVNGSSMYMWMRPDAGVTTSSGEITAWADQSGFLHNGTNAYSLTPNTTNPEFGTNAMNGYDVLTLDGTADAMVFDVDDITDDSYDMYFVWKKLEAQEQNASLFSNADNSGDTGSFQIAHSSGSGFYLNIRSNSNVDFGNYSFTESNNILGFSRRGDNTLDAYIDGSVQQSNFTLSNSDIMSVFSKFKLGVNRGSGKFLGLDLAEVLMFNRNVNTTQRIILQNYLSAKYNITLGANNKYTYDDGSGLFDHHLAGIGRETSTNLHKDAKGTGPVRIYNPSAMGNGEYLIWACDAINSTFTFSNLPSENYVDRLETKWRAGGSGDVGTVDVEFTLSELNVVSSVSESCRNYVLIIDNNSNFSSPEHRIKMSVVGDVLRATGVDLDGGDYFTVQIDNTISYTGGTWSHPLSTRSGSPEPNSEDDCFDVIVYDGTVTLSNYAEVNSVTINDASTLAIATGDAFLVYNSINTNSTGKMKMLGDAQLLQDPFEVLTTNPNSGLGFYSQFTTVAKNIYSYSYISPSASNGTTYNLQSNLRDGRGSNALSTTVDGANFVFDESNSDGVQGGSSTTLSTEWMYTYASDTDGFVLKKHTGNINVGLGVTVKEPGTTAQTYISKGIPNTGEYSFTLNEDSVALLANPYPSAINATLFFIDNPKVDVLYYYEDMSLSHVEEEYEGGYASYTSNGGGVAASTTAYDGSSFSGTITPQLYIPVGQAFFVSIPTNGDASTTADVVFKNGQRVNKFLGSNSVIFKQKELNILNSKPDPESLRLGFEFTLNDGGVYHRQIGVNFSEGNSLSTYDIGFDAPLFDEKSKDAYIENQNQKFVLAGVGELSDELEVPIKVVLDEDKEVTFMLDDIKDIEEVYLKDNVEETELPLKGKIVKKTLTSGVYDNRFSLTFKKQETLSNDNLEQDKLKIENKEGVIKVTSNEYNILSLSIIDIMGKTVHKSNTSIIDCSKIRSGIVVLKVETKQGVLVKKITL
ncbi:hypothetical protein FHR24_002560 [Wenyingzhuangia heitensis]|uniref:DUF8202 domain-containing protein n=1 Tax=Wenyingzhuangia heitensis TaxID=1487859 RepID=A0ABX0UGE5_9FLAO|nr:T9SS type A sorting domain-containing protein [Wenyingzhuangia heitensis]NIJ46082.1 hypothetical protein [Wenyingzhuangia heitensis]